MRTRKNIRWLSPSESESGLDVNTPSSTCEPHCPDRDSGSGRDRRAADDGSGRCRRHDVRGARLGPWPWHGPVRGARLCRELWLELGADPRPLLRGTVAGTAGNPEMTVELMGLTGRDTIVTGSGLAINRVPVGPAALIRRTAAGTFQVYTAPGCGGPWTAKAGLLGSGLTISTSGSQAVLGNLVRVCEKPVSAPTVARSPWSTMAERSGRSTTCRPSPTCAGSCRASRRRPGVRSVAARVCKPCGPRPLPRAVTRWPATESSTWPAPATPRRARSTAVRASRPGRAWLRSRMA